MLIQGDDNYGVGRMAREIATVVPGIQCVSFCRGQESDEIAALGVPVHVLPGGDYFRGFAPAAGLLPAIRGMMKARPHWLQCARELHAWCSARGIRVLHGHVWAHYLTLGAMRRAHRGRYRMIWHVHNFLNIHRHAGIPGWINCWQVRRGADQLLCVSRAVSRGWGRSGVHGRVVYNAIRAPGRDITRRLLSQRDTRRPVRLVGAGRMDPSKGHHVAIRAVARLRESGVDATLDIFGGPLSDNPYHETLRALALELGIEHAVVLHGYSSDLAERIGQFDIAVQTRVDPEPFGLFVAECMLQALPLAASDNGGIPELIRDGVHGRLYKPGDDRELAETIAGILRDPSAADRMAASARERARVMFAPERLGRELAGVYAESLDREGT